MFKQPITVKISSDKIEKELILLSDKDNTSVQDIADHVINFGRELVSETFLNRLKDINESFSVIVLDSDAIKEIGYNFYTQVLFIKFTGGNSFTYDDVPEVLFISFVEADSKGQFYNRFIKGQY